jgi:hypothetical protein
LKHAAYDKNGVPSVIVHAPAGFDAHAPLQLVVFLHGLRGCVTVLMSQGMAHCGPGTPEQEGWDLGRAHDQAHTNTLFVVPQLADAKRREDRPGRFARPGGFRDFLEELLRGPLAGPLGSARTLADVSRIDLVAHSAGYQTALAILEHGGIEASRIHSLVLLDALYAETERFAKYIESRDGLRLVDISLPNGTPERESAVLERRLRRSLGAEHVTSVDPNGIGDAIVRYRIVFARGTPPHRLVPATHLGEVLSALHQQSAQQ